MERSDRGFVLRVRCPRLAGQILRLGCPPTGGVSGTRSANPRHHACARVPALPGKTAVRTRQGTSMWMATCPLTCVSFVVLTTQRVENGGTTMLKRVVYVAVLVSDQDKAL